MADLLLKKEIRRGLGTRVIGREIVHFHETASTSDRAREFAEKGWPEGTVVVAERQTRGRGRRGRFWFSGDRTAVSLSIVLRPKIPLDGAPGITLVAAVAVAGALRKVAGRAVKIKWPNDVLMNGKKVCGILTEMSAGPGLVEYVIAGVGINVNVTMDELPPDLRDTATSLLIETGERFSRAGIARALLEEFERLYEMFTGRGIEPIVPLWKELSGIIGKRGMVELFNGTVEGKIIDLDKNGSLVIMDSNGREHRVVTGDIVLYD